MPGTNVYGPLFIIIALIIFVLLSRVMIKIWKGYTEKLQDEKTDKTISWVGPTILSIIIIGGFVVVCTLGWNAIMGITSNVSTYENPAEIESKKKIKAQVPPTNGELDAAKGDLKERAEEIPHQKALSSFDKAMQEEAAKIKERNQKGDVK